MAKDTKNNYWMKWALAVAVVVAIIAAYQLLPLQEWISSFQVWVKGLGPVGWIVFIAAYALATLSLAPGAFLTIAAGVAYGVAGFPIVIIGATLGAALAFLAARYLAHDKVQKSVETHPKMKAVDAAIKEEGWKIVGLLRLSPAVPFNLQNWFFGVTSVKFWPYIIATFFGIMPGTLLYVWIGTLGGQAGSDSEASTTKYIFYAVGLLATIAVTWYVSKKASAKLKEHDVKEEKKHD